MASSDGSRYHFGPLERRGLVAGWRGGQVATVASGLTVGVALLRWRPDGLGLLAATVAIGASIALACWPVGGATVEQWAPLVVARAMDRLTGRHRYVSAEPLRGRSVSSHGGSRRFLSDAGEGPHPVRAAASGVPAPFQGLSILAPPFAASDRRAGVLRDASAGTFTAVLPVRGGSFTLVESAERDRRVAAWAGALAGMATESSLVHRLQWVERSLPEDGSAALRHLEQGRELPADHGAVESYRQLVASDRCASTRHEILLAVSVRARSARTIRVGGDGDAGACVVLSRELCSLERRLEAAEVRVEAPLGRRALAQTLARAFAVSPRASDPRGRGWPWPLSMEEKWSWARLDGTWHATYWVAEWPRVDVRADFLAPAVLKGGLRRTLSLTMQPVDRLRAGREVEHARTADLADAELRRRGGFTRTARRRREEQVVARRETELADGHAQYRFSGFVTVTAPGEDELEAGCSEMEQAAVQAHLELRRLYGDQARAFTYTLPLGRGLA